MGMNVEMDVAVPAAVDMDAGTAALIKAVSPRVSFSRGAGCTIVTIEDVDGIHTAQIPDGVPGEDGYTPVKGVDYFDGAPGKDGEPGQDGYTPVKGVDYFDGAPGKDGKDGKDGEDGQDGYTPVKGVDYFDGEPGKDGAPGEDGYTPVKGVDYFDGDKGDPGVGIPAGGSPGQLIKKASALDFDTDWADDETPGIKADVAGLKSTQRVSSLSQTPLASNTVIESVGIPAYVGENDLATYAAYSLTDTGWYVFARISAPTGVTVTSGTTVTGADGAIVTVGAAYLDVAVRFEVAAVSRAVTVTWGPGRTDSFVFKASDLAVRNLDYRTTFYVYDLAPFVSWEYALTTDATFVTGSRYFTLISGEYVEAVEGTDWTAGAAVPSDTYYKHSKLTISGMTRNITYRLDEIVDCASEVILPEIEDDTHGCWYEFQLRHSGKFSMTLTPPAGVKIATEHTQAEDKGFNLIDLHYMKIDDIKMWRFMNAHSSIPA